MTRNQIIRMAIDDGATMAELGERYSVSRQRIEQIVNHTRKPRAPKSRYASVYVLRVGEFVKIGVALDVSRRLETIKSSCPYPVELLKVIDGGRELEARLHQMFDRFRHHHEWFHAVPEITESVER